jgi:predicted phage tail protein
MLRKIRLYGSLAKFVGARVLEADVRTAAEAVRFLVTNFDGLEQHMADKHYKVITHTAITLDELHDITNVDTIKIVPAVEGSGPVGRILAGVGLIVLSFFVPFAAPLLLGIGASLVLGGVAQLLTPVPRIGQGEDSVTDTKRSYNFSGIQQTSRAGTPVPLVYGKTLVGSVVISAGISDEVQVGASAPPPTITRSGEILTAPNVCEIRSIQWFRNGVPIPGATQSQYALTPLDYDQTITANIVCFDGSTVITENYDVPFEPTAYTYWRAVRPGYVGGWVNTAVAIPYWSTPFNPNVQPVSQYWFGGATVTIGTGSAGGAMAELMVLRVSDNSLYGYIMGWTGSVTPEDPFEIGTPFNFEFSNDAVNVIATWAGVEDASPPR